MNGGSTISSVSDFFPPGGGVGSAHDERPPSLNGIHGHASSSSPASSLDSGSMFITGLDHAQNFEASLRASFTIREIVDRLDANERAMREVQRALLDVDRKVNLLVERAVAASIPPPEFSNPFATHNGSSFSSPPALNGFSNGPRGSIIGNVAPNQAAPADDISVLSHKLSSLTTSVDQLLAIQQQPPHTPLNHSPQPNEVLSMHGHGIIPGNGAAMGLSLPIAPRNGTPRIPVTPTRTWSTGNLDLPLRLTDQLSSPLGRNIDNSGLRDKRRSVSSLLRRDSAAVRLFDSLGRPRAVQSH